MFPVLVIQNKKFLVKLERYCRAIAISLNLYTYLNGMTMFLTIAATWEMYYALIFLQRLAIFYFWIQDFIAKAATTMIEKYHSKIKFINAYVMFTCMSPSIIQ